MELIIAMAGGFIIDLIIGDPKSLPHPVRLMGSVISRGESLLRKYISTGRGLFWGGALLSVTLVSISFLVPYLILRTLPGIWALILNMLFLGMLLSTKSLKKESMRVYHALREDKLTEAQKRLSMIVGRDTDSLNKEQITKATVETVAENTSDGVIAPLFFFTLGGAPLCFAYKAVNTLDSMIGYKNEKYLYFGRFAARLDDILNYLPARLTALLMIAGAFLLKLDYKNACKIYLRDKNKHPSPNSGQPEAAAAGALGIELGGASYYGGKLVKKEKIGDRIKSATHEDIFTINRLMLITSFLALILLMLIRLAVSL